MPRTNRRLTRAAIVRALTRLGQLCAAQQSRVEIAIYGGTVMMLAYDCRKATRDIDAIFHPPEVVAPLIRQVARELHLADEWMNDGVRNFVAAREEQIAFDQLAIPGLVVTRPSPKYLLAMKCLAARLPTPLRAGAVADLKHLLRHLGIGSVQAVDAIFADYYGDRKLEPAKRWLVAQLIEEARREKARGK